MFWNIPPELRAIPASLLRHHIHPHEAAVAAGVAQGHAPAYEFPARAATNSTHGASVESLLTALESEYVRRRSMGSFVGSSAVQMPIQAAVAAGGMNHMPEPMAPDGTVASLRTVPLARGVLSPRSVQMTAPELHALAAQQNNVVAASGQEANDRRARALQDVAAKMAALHEYMGR